VEEAYDRAYAPLQRFMLTQTREEDLRLFLDLADGSRIDIVCAIEVDAEAEEITVDYTGTSDASPWGINVVRNYTHAYTTFTVRSVLNPEIPNNHGSLSPISMIAPEGSIVNAVLPQPGTARHVVGMFLPNALLMALAQIRAEESMAEGSGAVWTMQVNGSHEDGSPFITAMFTYAGGSEPGRRIPDCPHAPIRRASRLFRLRWWRRRHRSTSTARNFAKARVVVVPRPVGSGRLSSSASTHRATGS
jgi:N-methylhydantoinase B/oxoprolinase/acetone carboxylase alpha subunit